MTSIRTSRSDDGRHVCVARGCQRRITIRLLMCPPHWRLVPATLRAAIWRTYRPGQEHDHHSSPEYPAAASEAIEAVAACDRRWIR